MSQEVCLENSHDWESVSVIDTELVDGDRYEVVLVSCLECGQEEIRIGDKIIDEETISL